MAKPTADLNSRKVEVLPAFGRWDGFFEVVGVKKPGGGGCWCMACTIPFVDDRDAWSIVCFVVRGGYRKLGLMHPLLDGAVEHARRHGAEVVEGYPAETGGDRVDVISGYVGTTALFERHGFERVQETTAHSGGRVRWVMRKELRGS